MSANAWFGAGTAAIVAALLGFGLKVLPRENMQVLAIIPVRRRADGRWQGVNLTWYGVMQAVAMVLSVSLALVLALSVGVPLGETVLVVLVLLAAGLPAASLVARAVERRRKTFTVGGAVSVAMLLLPPVALTCDAYSGADHALAMVAALGIAYAMGEGIGRLACISFGCCYGRRLDSCPPWLRSAFRGWAAVVVGPTRKAAYAGGCEKVPLLPVPALSACVLCVAAVASMLLFFGGSIRAAAMLSLGVALVWRFVAELLRADYRGGGALSAYQWMALLCIGYMAPWVLHFAGATVMPDIRRAAWLVGEPTTYLALLGLGTVVFAYLGTSSVTAATIELTIDDGSVADRKRAVTLM